MKLRKVIHFLCGIFGHKWKTYSRGQMCEKCGKKRYMDKWYWEIKNKQKIITNKKIEIMDFIKKSRPFGTDRDTISLEEYNRNGNILLGNEPIDKCDYEKKYKEALERATKICNSDFEPNDKSILCSIIFPELKESKDERICREIIDALRARDEKTPTVWLEWLEEKGKCKEENKKEEIVARYPCAGDPILCNPKRDGNILIYSGTKLEEEYELSDLKTEKD